MVHFHRYLKMKAVLGFFLNSSILLLILTQLGYFQELVQDEVVGLSYPLAVA